MKLHIRRSTIYKSLLLGATSFLLGFIYNYHLPRVESWLLVEAERLSREHLPIRIYAQKLNFHLLPLGIVLEDVHILPQAPIDKILAPTVLKEVGARLSLWPLLRGEVRLSQVYLRDSEISVFLHQQMFAGQKNPRQFKLDFDKLYSLPLDEVMLEDVTIQGRLDPQGIVFRTTKLNLLVENRYQSIFVELNAPQVLLKPSGPVNPINAQLELRGLAEAKEMQISAFKLKVDESFIVASGRFNGDLSVGKLENGALDARTKINLSDINLWGRVLETKTKIPELKGHAEVDVGLEIRQGKGYKVEAEVNTHDVQIDKFIVGNVQGHATSDLKTLQADSIHFENSAGKVDVEKLNMTLEPKMTASLNVKVPGLEVHQLLENLSVKNVPIKVPVKGDATCEAALNDHPEVVCQAKMVTTGVHVDTGRPQFTTIVEINEAHGHGTVKVNAKQVEYKADLEMGADSKGTSDGVINYDTGFKINYAAEKLAFKDVKNIVNLKLEGETKVTGSTQGTTDWATIDMNVDGKDFWLEDYPLGQASAKVNYKAGYLSFDNVAGQFEVSRYSGLVQVDLNKDRLRVSGQIPFMDLKDIQKLFARKVTLPIQMAGTGTGKVEAEGPFNITKMSYDFKSSFYRGQIAKETFDEVQFNVKATDGLVHSEKILLTKANGSIDVKGQITPSGQIDTVAVGRAMRLEQSENVLALGFDIQGLADFTVLIRGQLPHPDVELNGRMSKVMLADRPAEDSVFKLNFLPDRMEGSGQFLGTTLIADATLPYDANAPFLLKLKARKLNMTNLFSLVSRSARQIDFDTALSMDVNLQAPHGGFWASSGKVAVSEFSVRKGGKTMAAEKPMALNFHQGTVNSENFSLTSGDSYLKLDVAGLTRNNLNASLNGKMDLSLLGLFTPFISDLRGNMAVSMDLRGTMDKPLLSGSSYIEKGYVKLVDFPHAFSNGRADVLFNDNQILLNAVRADLGGGKVSGEGKIKFAGESHPVDIRGSFADVRLNIPDGFKTQGSGTMSIHGDRFPYAMDINYDVIGGEVVAEFNADAGGVATIKPSPYLPHFIEQETFHPFYLSLDVNLKNSISVNNSILRTHVNGHLKANGDPDHLLLNGTLTPAPGGKLYFSDQPFEINSGYAEWADNPPTDPKIYLTASTHIQETFIDDQNHTTINQYDISLLVQGHGKNSEIQLTSLPPLSQREIVSLVALGTTGNTTNTDMSKTANPNASTALGGQLLKQAGGKQVKDALGVDVRLFTAKLSQQQNAIDNTTSPKVTLSKQWTPNFGASASSTIESTPDNTVKLEYKLNKNVSAVGSWDSRETLHDEVNPPTKSVFGLDLQYKMQFK